MEFSQRAAAIRYNPYDLRFDWLLPQRVVKFSQPVTAIRYDPYGLPYVMLFLAIVQFPKSLYLHN